LRARPTSDPLSAKKERRREEWFQANRRLERVTELSFGPECGYTDNGLATAVVFPTEPARAQFVSVPPGVVVVGWAGAARVRVWVAHARAGHVGVVRFFVNNGRFFLHDGRFFRGGFGGLGFARGGFGGPGMVRGGFGGGRR
jgi:hypothetical protein